MASRVKNPTSVYEDAGLIPDLTQWVQYLQVATSCSVSQRCGLDPTLLWLWAGSCSSDVTPSPWTSICHRWGHYKNYPKSVPSFYCYYPPRSILDWIRLRVPWWTPTIHSSGSCWSCPLFPICFTWSLKKKIPTHDHGPVALSCPLDLSLACLCK